MTFFSSIFFLNMYYSGLNDGMWSEHLYLNLKWFSIHSSKEK